MTKCPWIVFDVHRVRRDAKSDFSDFVARPNAARCWTLAPKSFTYRSWESRRIRRDRAWLRIGARGDVEYSVYRREEIQVTRRQSVYVWLSSSRLTLLPWADVTPPGSFVNFIVWWIIATDSPFRRARPQNGHALNSHPITTVLAHGCDLILTSHMNKLAVAVFFVTFPSD